MPKSHQLQAQTGVRGSCQTFRHTCSHTQGSGWQENVCRWGGRCYGCGPKFQSPRSRPEVCRGPRHHPSRRHRERIPLRQPCFRTGASSENVRIPVLHTCPMGWSLLDPSPWIRASQHHPCCAHDSRVANLSSTDLALAGHVFLVTQQSPAQAWPPCQQGGDPVTSSWGPT